MMSNLQNKTKLVTDQAGKRSVADTLTRLGISYEYEEKLLNKDDNPLDYRLPYFTVSYEGDTYFWEHLGMLSVPSQTIIDMAKRVKDEIIQEDPALLMYFDNALMRNG